VTSNVFESSLFSVCPDFWNIHIATNQNNAAALHAVRYLLYGGIHAHAEREQNVQAVGLGSYLGMIVTLAYVFFPKRHPQ